MVTTKNSSMHVKILDYFILVIIVFFEPLGPFTPNGRATPTIGMLMHKLFAF
jgi:membrane protein DedA with SNARE-associated domain